MGQDETGHLDGELEIEGVAAAKQAHIDPFHAFIQPRENEPAGFLPRDDHPAWEAQSAKEFSQSMVRGTRGKQLERHQR
jgi:hypothetical protein